MMRSRALVHRLTVAVLASLAGGILALSVAVPALAASAPRPASLSDTRVAGSTVSTVLTVPATVETVTVKPGSVVVTVGGRPLQATVSQVQQESRSALIVVDTSGSMGAAGIAAAAEAARVYLSVVPADVRVGLVTFSDRARLLVSPTRDRAAVTRMLPGLNSKGQTALYDGLLVGVQNLGATGSRSLILLSDGADTVSRSGLAAALQAVGTAGIRVEVVAFHTSESQDSNLASVASTGGGRLLRAGDAPALTSAFRAAATALAGQVRLAIETPPGLTGQQPLVVRAIANEQPVQATAVLAFPAGAPQSASDANKGVTPSALQAGSLSSGPAAATGIAGTSGAGASRSRAGLSMALWASAVFAGLLAVGCFLISPLFTPVARQRARAMDGYIGFTAAATTVKAAPTAISGQVLLLSDKLIGGRASTARSAVLLERADLPLLVNEWFVLRFVAVLVSLTVSWVLLHGSMAGTVAAIVVGTALGVIAPAVFLRVVARRRARKFESQLPDTLTLMASSLSTGFSLVQAIHAVVRDASEPTAKEFGRALAETRIGSELEDSLDRLAHRMGSTNLELTIMAIRVQRQVGGSLAETLRNTASTLRERESLQRHVAALSADGRLSAYILIVLPIAMFLYLYVVNRSYLEQLWTTGMGFALSGFGLVMMAVGIVWMRKTVEVRV